MKKLTAILTSVMVPAFLMTGCNTGTSNPSGAQTIGTSYGVTDDGELYLNKGSDWVNVSSMSESSPRAMVLSCNDTNCLTITTQGTLSASKDFVNWEPVNSSDTESGNALQMSKALYDLINAKEGNSQKSSQATSSDQDEFIAVGASGEIDLVTQDSSVSNNISNNALRNHLKLTNIPVQGGSTDDYYSVHRNSKGDYIAVGQHDAIVGVVKAAVIPESYNSIGIKSKYGASVKHREENRGSLHSVYCTENTVDKVCVTVGVDGMAYKSTDDGNSWKQIPNVFKKSLWTVTSNGESSEEVMVTGGDDHIYYSKDKGDSWLSAKMPESLNNYTVYNIHYNKDSRIMMAAFSAADAKFDGSILVSNDNGMSWKIAKAVKIDEQNQTQAGISVNINITKMDNVCKTAYCTVSQVSQNLNKQIKNISQKFVIKFQSL